MTLLHEPTMAEKLARAEAFWSGRAPGPNAWESDGEDPTETLYNDDYFRSLGK